MLLTSADIKCGIKAQVRPCLYGARLDALGWGGMRIRKMVESDREDVISWTLKTWDWGDYIESVWDEWVKDGGLYGIEIDGRVVAILHIKVIRPGVAWLEGMRVKPEFRGRGLAKILTRHVLAVARERGCWKAMLSVSSVNKPAQRVVEKLGFTVYGRLRDFYLERPPTPKGRNIKLKPLRWGEAIGYRWLNTNNLLIGDEMPWRFIELTEDEYTQLSSNGMAGAINGSLIISGGTIVFQDKKELYIRYLEAASNADMEQIAQWITHQMKTRKVQAAYGYMPPTKTYVEAFKNLGARVKNREILIYKLELTNL